MALPGSGPKTVYYRELFRESDIKSAVPFLGFHSPFQGVVFVFSFPWFSLLRCQRQPRGRFPLALHSNDFTQRLMAERLTFIALAARRECSSDPGPVLPLRL